MHNLFQPILDVARIQAKTVTKEGLNNDKANEKGNIRLVVWRISPIHAHPAVGGTYYDVF